MESHVRLQTDGMSMPQQSVTPFNPANAAWPGLSQGVMLKGSGVFLLTGHVGVDANGDPVTSSLEDQIVALFENLKQTLAAGGLDFRHVGRLTAYVTESGPEIVDVLRRVRSRYLNQDAPPAGVLIQVVALYDPRLKIEIEAIGVVP